MNDLPYDTRMLVPVWWIRIGAIPRSFQYSKLHQYFEVQVSCSSFIFLNKKMLERNVNDNNFINS